MLTKGDLYGYLFRMIKSLRMARHKNDLTQEKLAELVGVSRWWINRIEIGERKASPVVAKKIQKILSKHISLADIRPDIWGD